MPDPAQKASSTRASSAAAPYQAQSLPTRIATEEVTANIEKQWWHELQTDPVATFTALLFFATCLLWWATRQLVRGADSTARRQLRAYVITDQGNVDAIDQMCSAYVQVRNVGQTPATNVRVASAIGIDVYPLPKLREVKSAPHAAQGVLGGSASHHHRIELGRALNPIEVSQLQATTHALYALGCVSYEDVFGDKHETTFAYYFGGNAGVGVDGIMALYKEGNHLE